MSEPYNKQVMRRLVEPFQAATGLTEFSLEDVASWAIQNDLWQPPLKSQIALLREELSAAVRSDRKDYDGRKVRQYHCVERPLGNGYVQMVWAHIDVATPSFMEQSFARRRRNLADRSYQLHSDIVYWNEQKNPAEPVEMLFDFRDDIADRDHSADLE